MTTHLDLRRADFEEWFSDGWTYPQAVERSGDGYKLMSTQSSWGAWQAALLAAARSASLPPMLAHNKQFTPMEARSTRVYLARNSGGFDVRNCPDAESLAQFIAEACNDAASRCRAQGGITQPETAARASLQADEGKDDALDLARRALETSYSKDVARDVERRNAIKAIAAIAAKEQS
jgi:hypothetical protein